jgi:hypothetical protein
VNSKGLDRPVVVKYAFGSGPAWVTNPLDHDPDSEVIGKAELVVGAACEGKPNHVETKAQEPRQQLRRQLRLAQAQIGNAQSDRLSIEKETPALITQRTNPKGELHGSRTHSFLADLQPQPVQPGLIE